MDKYMFNVNNKDTNTLIVGFEQVSKPLYDFQLLIIFSKRSIFWKVSECSSESTTVGFDH